MKSVKIWTQAPPRLKILFVNNKCKFIAFLTISRLFISDGLDVKEEIISGSKDDPQPIKDINHFSNPKKKAKKSSYYNYKPKTPINASELTKEELSKLHYTKVMTLKVDEKIEIEQEHSIKIIDPDASTNQLGFKCRICGARTYSKEERQNHWKKGKICLMKIDICFGIILEFQRRNANFVMKHFLTN